MTSPLRVHWFSPAPPARTGIAEVTNVVLPALAKHAQVTLWTSQTEWSRELEGHVSVRQFNGETTPLPDGPRDVCFYNLGNNGNHHADIVKASLRQSGIVILHDTCLQGLRVAPGVAPYLQQIGKPPPVAGESHFEGLGIEQARAAIAHTRDGYDALTSAGLTCLQADLPYLPPTASTSSSLATRARRAQPNARRRLTVFGFLNWNRRLGSVLQALSCMPERAQFHLDIYGEVYEPHLRPLARACGLEAHVTFHGFVSDDVLDRALSETDLAINLRYPTMGESSLSQLRIWGHSLPSIVTRGGWYADLDEGVVDFIRTEYEIEDLQNAFRRLLSTPEYFAAQGARGYERLITLHDPNRYARALVDFAEQILTGNAAPLGPT